MKKLKETTKYLIKTYAYNFKVCFGIKFLHNVSGENPVRHTFNTISKIIFSNTSGNFKDACEYLTENFCDTNFQMKENNVINNMKIFFTQETDKYGKLVSFLSGKSSFIPFNKNLINNHDIIPSCTESIKSAYQNSLDSFTVNGKDIGYNGLQTSQGNNKIDDKIEFNKINIIKLPLSCLKAAAETCKSIKSILFYSAVGTSIDLFSENIIGDMFYIPTMIKVAGMLSLPTLIDDFENKVDHHFYQEDNDLNAVEFSVL